MAQFNDRQFYQYPPFNPIIPAPVWGKDAEYAVPVVSSVGNGPKGDKGDSLEFNSIGATIDASSDQPTVEVESTGDPLKPDVTFHFSGIKGTPGAKGDKGDKGDTFEFDDLTEEQLDDLRSSIATVYYRSDENNYYTTGTNTTRVTVPISTYNASTDIMFVNVEGIDLLEGFDWERDGNDIVFSEPIVHDNACIRFKTLRAVAVTPEDYDALKGDPGATGPQGPKGEDGEDAPQPLVLETGMPPNHTLPDITYATAMNAIKEEAPIYLEAYTGDLMAAAHYFIFKMNEYTLLPLSHSVILEFSMLFHNLTDYYQYKFSITLYDHDEVQTPDTITFENNNIISPATTSQLGSVKVGTGLSIDNNGVLSANPGAAGTWEDLRLGVRAEIDTSKSWFKARKNADNTVNVIGEFAFTTAVSNSTFFMAYFDDDKYNPHQAATPYPSGSYSDNGIPVGWHGTQKVSLSWGYANATGPVLVMENASLDASEIVHVNFTYTCMD